MNWVWAKGVNAFPWKFYELCLINIVCLQVFELTRPLHEYRQEHNRLGVHVYWLFVGYRVRFMRLTRDQPSWCHIICCCTKYTVRPAGLVGRDLRNPSPFGLALSCCNRDPSSPTHRITCLSTWLLINNLRLPWTIPNSLLAYHTNFRSVAYDTGLELL